MNVWETSESGHRCAGHLLLGNKVSFIPSRSRTPVTVYSRELQQFSWLGCIKFLLYAFH